MWDAIRLPTILDRASITELRPRFEHAGTGTSLVLDAAYLQRVEATGVQLLCALVLGAERRGVIVTWIRVSAMLVHAVKLLGIGDVLQMDGAGAEARDARD